MSILRMNYRLIMVGIGFMMAGARVAAFEPPAATEVPNSAVVDRLLHASSEELFSLGLLQDDVVESLDDAGASGFQNASVFRLRPLYWAPEMDGSMSLDDLFGVSTLLDFDNDLGVDDPNPSFGGEVGIQLGAIQLRISGFSIESSSVVTATQSITYGGVTIALGDLVDTDNDIQNYKFLLGWSLLNPVDHGVGLAISSGINWYQVEATVEDVTSTLSDRIDEELPIPVMGLHLEVPLDSLLISVDVSGLSIEVEEVNVDYLDLSVALAWMPTPGVSIVGGYRIIDADLTMDDFHFDAKLSGPFFGVEIRF